jgi:two-component system chemotaxis response regulator CheB
MDVCKIRDQLVCKLKAAAESRSRRSRVPAASSIVVPAREVTHPSAEVIALGTSTGGPKALQQILPMLPADLTAGILIVQHMPLGFTGPFARRLDSLSKIAVREAEQDALIEPGTVYIAPAGQHMTVVRTPTGRVAIRLSATPDNTLHIPSVDVTMLSVAEVYRSRAMGIIMTGMGSDGAKGMHSIRNEGGVTVGQDEPSCTVYGMPRVCAEMQILDRVVPLMQIPAQILLASGYRHRE